MELTPERQALIDAHVAETRQLMTDYAFELNDLVRLTLSAARGSPHKVYYPMDPVQDGMRRWQEFGRRLDKLTDAVRRSRERLQVPPFDPEAPA